MTRAFDLHDWRLLERIVGLTSRLNCAYKQVDVRESGPIYRAHVEFTGSPDALRRLDAQLTKLLNDDKEIHR